MNLKDLEEQAKFKQGFNGSYCEALRYSKLRCIAAHGRIIGEICKRAHREQYPAERQYKDNIKEALIEFSTSLVRIAIATNISVDEIAMEIESCSPQSDGIKKIAEELQEKMEKISSKGGLIDPSKVLGEIPKTELKDTIATLLLRTKQLGQIYGIELFSDTRPRDGGER